MVKTIIGVLIGVSIGVACRWFDVPVPAPPRLTGAILVLALTGGYVATDRFLEARAGSAVERPAEDRTGTDGGVG